MPRLRAMDRRTLLRGAGTAIGLPLLDAMLPRLARAQQSPMRLGIFCFPFGVHQQAWAAKTFGGTFAMPDNLKALTPHQSRVILTSGLGAHGLPQGSHMASVPYFTTEPLNKCVFRVRSKSVDVMISEHLRKDNPALHHLVTLPQDAYGFSGCYSHGSESWQASISTYLSWSGETTATTQIRSPRAVFDKLFTGANPAPAGDPLVAFRKARRMSVLDSVLQPSNSVASLLGSSDKKKLDQYLTNIREVERTLNAAPTPVQGCAPGAQPASSMPFEQVTKAFLDLAVLAMVCDKSRVVTQAMDTEGEIHRGFSSLGIGTSVGHHLYSHTSSNEGGVAASTKPPIYLKITAWYAEQLAYLLTKMTGYQEAGKDLLYNSVIVYGSGMGPDGQAHDQRDIPVVIAGELQGKIRTGQAINASRTRMANLWLAILQKFGVPASSYASSTGALSL